MPSSRLKFADSYVEMIMSVHYVDYVNDRHTQYFIIGPDGKRYGELFEDNIT